MTTTDTKRHRILYANISLSRKPDIDRLDWEAEIRERLGPVGKIDDLVTAEMDEELLDES